MIFDVIEGENGYQYHERVVWVYTIRVLPALHLEWNVSNIENFKTIINNSVGKYYKYVVMNFDHKEVASVLTNISNEKLPLLEIELT